MATLGLRKSKSWSQAGGWNARTVTTEAGKQKMGDPRQKEIHCQ